MTIKNRCIGELSFRSEVKAVKLRRDRVVVVLESKIYVYNFADLKLVDHIETTSNPKGLCALCPFASNTVLASPGLQKGHVRVELYDLKKTQVIVAHESGLACIALNFDGTRLATASETGTIVRIFDTQTGTNLQEVRRGIDKAEIYSLAFNNNSQWLACSSDKGTVHVYRMKLAESGSEASESKSNPKSSLSFFARVLPSYIGSEWSFAHFRVPAGLRCIVAFGSEANSVVVVCSDGSFYKAIFDPDQPNHECAQEHHDKFVKPPPTVEGG